MGFYYIIIVAIYILLSYTSYYITKIIMHLIKKEKAKSILGAFYESIDCCFLLTLIDLFIYNGFVLSSLTYNLCNMVSTILCTIIVYFMAKGFKIKNIFFEKLNLKIGLIYLIIAMIQEACKFITMTIKSI